MKPTVSDRKKGMFSSFLGLMQRTLVSRVAKSMSSSSTVFFAAYPFSVLSPYMSTMRFMIVDLPAFV